MSTNYDLITVGGGLAGAALARAMAQHGTSVLVIERETGFKDRGRGEQLASWGAAEARELGIYELLLSTCSRELPWWNIYLGPMQVDHRDMPATTLHGTPNVSFFHPEMQETLLQAATEAGVEVRRGARVKSIQPGASPRVTVEQDGQVEEITARLVVGADGRSSPVRKWAGFKVNRDSDFLRIAGLFFEGLTAPDDGVHLVVNPTTHHTVLLAPQGNGRARSYLISCSDEGIRLHGEKDVPQFLELTLGTGVTPSWYESARPAGPLATFEGADTWVEHPYRDGIALVGDAAATSDPSWGQGLSLTLRDVRILRDELLASGDWEAAGHAYAEEHDSYYSALHMVEGWFTSLLYERGPVADARRARSLPRLSQERSVTLDHFQSGPDCAPADEACRRRLFAED